MAAAERDGLALLQQTRASASEAGKALLRQAEERAAGKTEEIRADALREAEALRREAERHMEEAAEMIVGRVVKD